MITREEAAALVAGDETAAIGRLDLARTVVALHDEVERLRVDLKIAQDDNEGLANKLGDSDWGIFNAAAERDAARLELRRLRAAEAPGTDDEAFYSSDWHFSLGRQCWVHASGATVPSGPACATLDTMRAAAPGSV